MTAENEPVETTTPSSKTFQLPEKGECHSNTWYTRLHELYTVPHALVVISMISLAAVITLTVRTENARQAQAHRLAQRCAFVYLAPTNLTDIKPLGRSLKSLNANFRFDMKQKIIVVHADIPPVVQGRLQSLSEAPVDFREITLEHRVQLNATNMSPHPEPSPQLRRITSADIFRFWFYTAVHKDFGRTGLFADVDYIVRLDTNGVFSARIKKDFFEDFALSGAQYGYQSIGRECAKNSTIALQNLATSYVELNGITPRGAELWTMIVDEPRRKCLPKYGTRLELINLRFFRTHSGIQDWLRYVDTNGGIAEYGWADSVLRYITVALYAAPEKVLKVSFTHLPYKAIPTSDL